MRILLATQLEPGEAQAWLAALQLAAPGHEWWQRPELDGALRAEGLSALVPTPALKADVAIVANPPPGVLAGVQGLRLIQSLWAGVDRLTADTTVPVDVPLARMVDPSMTAAMVESALWAVTSLHRSFFDYAHQQRRAQWLQQVQRRAEDVAVLVLGLGTMGAAVAARLAAQGYRVAAWRRGHGCSAPEGVAALHGQDAALNTALAEADVVINLLPLTPETRGMIDAAFLARMKPSAALVNFGRGAHVVEADLLAALDEGKLGHAVLDVFTTEPLPAEHPFWHHSRVTVLPHVAALTDLRSAAQVVAANLRRLESGQPLLHLVDRQRGY